MRRFLLVFALLFSIHSYAQLIISNDTTVCGSYDDTLFALSAIQSSMAMDDQHDIAVPIGFTFNFYGIPYTQLVVSGNGYVTFDISQANQAKAKRLTCKLKPDQPPNTPSINSTRSISCLRA